MTLQHYRAPSPARRALHAVLDGLWWVVAGGSERGRGVVPLVVAVVVSPRWVGPGGVVVGVLTSKRVVAAFAVACTLCWLVLPWSALTLAVTLPTVLCLAVVLGRSMHRDSVRGELRSQHQSEGWVSYLKHRRTLSAHAARHVAARNRPSMRALATSPVTHEQSAWRTERLPVRECGTWMGATAVGPLVPLHCWVPHRDSIGIVAPPQTIKTVWMGHHIRGHVGAVVATGSRADVYRLTQRARARRARSGRVEVFNPRGLDELPSTIRFDPLIDCEDPEAAEARAGALVQAITPENTEDQNWFDEAADVLCSMLLVAALSPRHDMASVAAWCTGPGRAKSAAELMEQYRDVLPPARPDALVQFLGSSATKGRDSVFRLLRQATAFMSIARVAEACLPQDGESRFDVARFLADRGTLYLLGAAKENSPVAPLLAALTSYIFDEATRLAATPEVGGKLDPPLMLALDEVALIAPVPLDDWIAYAGGSGVQIIWAVQSFSQLDKKWDENGARTIWDATNVKAIGGGLSDAKDLRELVELCGRKPGETADNVYGDELITIAQIRTLPPWHALLIHRASDPTIVRIPKPASAPLARRTLEKV